MSFCSYFKINLTSCSCNVQDLLNLGLPLHDMFTSDSKLVHNFTTLLTTFYWLVNNFFKTLLVNDELFMTCSWTVHYLFMIFHDLFMIHIWLTNDMFLTWLVHDLDLFMTCSLIVHDLLIACTWLAHDIVVLTYS